MKTKINNLVSKWWIKLTGVLILYFLFLFQNIKLGEEYHGKYGLAGVIWSDAYNYYEYLPGVFIRKMPTRFKSGLRIRPGFSVNKVTYGVALMQAPFFFANHQIQTWRGFSGTGFENSYGCSILIAASTYVFAGLILVFLFLRKSFNSFTAWISVIGIFYGTNMPHYVYAEPGMAHAYSFFCVALIFYFSDKFYQNPKFGWNLILVAIGVSIAVIVRPVNIFVILIFALYGCYTLADLGARIKLLFSKFWLIPTFLIVGFIFLLPQMYYWFITTEKWLVFSYGLNNEKFEYFSNPKIWTALFHQQGGWFPYSQIMLVSIIALPFLIYKKKFNGLMIVVVFGSVLYVCASWWAINFMCAHGYRSLIDYYAILIIPFAFAVHAAFQSKIKWIRIGFPIVMLALIYVAFRMNLDFAIYERCDSKEFTFYHYIKLYDDYF